MKHYDWDKTTELRLCKLQKEHKNAIPVLGGAVFAATAIKNNDLETFVEHLVSVPRNSVFFGWDEGIKDALNTFCHLCLVDPKLIEVYIGMTFVEVEELYN